MCSVVGHSSLPHCTEERSPQRVTRALLFIAPVIFETLGVVHRHILHCVVSVAGEPFLIFLRANGHASANFRLRFDT